MICRTRSTGRAWSPSSTPASPISCATSTSEPLYEQFEALDARFRKILQFWDPAEREYLAEAIVEDPERFGASPAEVDTAKRVLDAKRIEQELVLRRTGYRLSILSWMLHIAGEHDETAWARIRGYAETLPNVDELLPSAAYALDQRR